VSSPACAALLRPPGAVGSALGSHDDSSLVRSTPLDGVEG